MLDTIKEVFMTDTPLRGVTPYGGQSQLKWILELMGHSKQMR